MSHGLDRARRLAARAPTRIDLGGGWTDVPPYPARHGGFVCNLAIARYATVTLLDAPGAPADDAAEGGALVAAAVRRAGIAGLRATLASDFPIGAGLGGSSAAGVAVAGALAHWRGDSPTPTELAERSRAVEVEDLGIAGGRQDHYAAAHGGALALTFLADRVDARRLALDEATRAAIERRLLLVYTGQSRISGDTIAAVLDGYATGEPRVLHALVRMKALAADTAAALERGDVDAAGALVGEHWTHQRALHPAITTPRIDEIMRRAAAAGALGGKALGASGGGCVALIARDEAVEAVRDAVAPLGELLSFTLAERGFEVTT